MAPPGLSPIQRKEAVRSVPRSKVVPRVAPSFRTGHFLEGDMPENAFTMKKSYAPSEIEGKIYEGWEKTGAFVAKRVPGKKPFTIMMPPPNITGELHMGHALDCTLQDSLARFHRMYGDPTLWLPGTDHASIATELKIVEQIAAEGLSKQEIGREAFLERAWQWKKKYGGRITEQLRSLGASCDWSRERFTMDEGCSHAVREVFVRLYRKGLVYRGDRIINWCSDCRTALSDTEVEYEEKQSQLWHIRYPGVEGEEGVIVATTRPETMLGDTGVAVNPEDPRYRDLVGKKVLLPLMNREIPVVADAYVDRTFGTGAVKMTPAHDPNDFEVAERHGLEFRCVIGLDGLMNEEAGEAYRGMTTLQCREQVLRDLEDQGLLVKAEGHSHNVGACYRCGTTVEPLISRQWFVSMAPLARPAIEAVRSGETRFIPERYSRIYFNWMENIRDWCISRQLWWGHRIPAWYCESCGEMTVATEAPEACPACGAEHPVQDEDVLDTWFSSALWPFSTLGWPEDTEDLRYFYPTSTLVTGYDIIFFWVARMMFSGIENMGQVPFDTVLIHGLVRDAQGRKMAKSLGNGIDPLEIVSSYGADALRFSLCMGISPGNDMRYSQEKVEAARNFANKVWNAARFVLMNLEGQEEPLQGRAFTTADKWILSRCMGAARETAEHLLRSEHGLAAQKLYDFVWSEFCDWYIESVKSDLSGGDPVRKATARAVLLYVLSALLRMLHPFMPFLTEELYGQLPGLAGASCMASTWPVYREDLVFGEEERRMQAIMDVIRAIRNLRAEMKVQPSQRLRLLIKPTVGWESTFATADEYFRRLAGASSVEILKGDESVPEKTVTVVSPFCEVLIPLGDLVDPEKEMKRIRRELQDAEGERARAQTRLSNPGFLGKAPPALVEAERKKLTDIDKVVEALHARLEELKP